MDAIRHYGCAGCHEIAGLEEEGRIGTDLTVEGSKPLERLDFALKGHEAEIEGWYNHKGFFERKLENPAFFDEGKEREPRERLRMPNFGLNREEINALTTFLLGAVETTFPEEYRYEPEDERAHVQEGWWIVTPPQLHGMPPDPAGQRFVVHDDSALCRRSRLGRATAPAAVYGGGTGAA